MRRRFTLAIVGVVAGALLFAGLGTLVLLAAQSRRAARSDVTQLASRIAAAYSRPASQRTPVPALRTLQDVLHRTQQLTLIVIAPTTNLGTLPGGVTAADLQLPSLRAGRTVSGFRRNTAYAAAPFTSGPRQLAVVVTQGAAGIGGPGAYFLLSAAVALAVAFAIAETLARRITRPVVQAEQAAVSIAGGDLTARVRPPPDAYPELGSLAAAINAMADNLERLRGQERQFVLSVSHDLRTPLTSIRGFAEALADGTATDTAQVAGVIAAEARRLERLVRDLLDLAKLDARGFSFHVRPTDLWEVVDDTALGFSPTAEDLGLAVVVHEPGGSAFPVAADPDRLAQVVANLVENACKYASTTVEVGTWFRPGPGAPEAVVTVDDDGPGIPAEELPHVFDRLWTSSRGPGRSVGSGLGLAIVTELVNAMGGAVSAESPVPRQGAAAAGPGTRVVVRLRGAA